MIHFKTHLRVLRGSGNVKREGELPLKAGLIDDGEILEKFALPALDLQVKAYLKLRKRLGEFGKDRTMKKVWILYVV